ncbi:hypothetical protein SAMN02745883_01750 [Caminicella sporogenes DSM 14501]|uniref:Uncharacterized protein n=1 Tax=Caminicella sporogenes DSM 14501 TaxID=1121266 RepID=A0A1M6RDI5_9FIRM|nr:hypothetical protein [Caminicella sporogenes]RKD25199.1 hypothetical protein BET04_02985 [Caminicella sporogenes]SHK30418.1 hypothetical protein SAMN02745883_01750 [Caminicella sporogenes DSM 14501]
MNKNLKCVKRSSIDTNKREFLIIANQIKNAKDIEDCSNIIVSTIKSSELDYNKITTLFAMYCNKCIGIFLENLEKDIKDEVVPSIIEKIGEDVYSLCNKTIEKVKEIFILKEDGDQVIKYLRKLIKYIIKSFSYNDGYWEREEYIYDCMHLLAKDEFTKKYNLEIPYLYILMWSAISLFSRRKGHDGLKYDKENVSYCLRRLGNVMIQILLGESVCDGNIYIPKIEGKEYLDERIEVKFDGLLPYIKNVENRTKEYKSFKDKIISKEVLLRIPMIPIEVTEGTAEEIKIFLDLVKERNLLLETNEKLKQAKGDLKKAYLNLEALNKKNTAMVRRYSHVWTNILYPDVVLNVAKKLLNSSEYKEDAKKLLFAYNNENMMKQQIKMLELRHSNDSVELKTRFRKSIAKQNDLSNEIVCLDHLINYALERVLFRIFMESSERAMRIRNEFKLVGLDMEKLRVDFEKSIIVNEASCFEWINKNMMEICKLQNESWEMLRIKKNSYASDFLIEVFIEIFINLLTYGSKKSNFKSTLEFDEVRVFNTDYLRLVTSNRIDEGFGTYRGGTEEGIKSLEEVLKMINSNFRGENELKQYIEVNKIENTYSMSILFRRDLFIRGKGYAKLTK